MTNPLMRYLLLILLLVFGCGVPESDYNKLKAENEQLSKELDEFKDTHEIYPVYSFFQTLVHALISDFPSRCTKKFLSDERVRTVQTLVHVVGG